MYGEKKRSKGRERAGRERSREKDEFEQKIIDLARVTRVMAGGKRMRFRACVAIGDKKGRVAIGMAKGADVTAAITKAVNVAKKNIIEVPIVNSTIPHAIYVKMGAAKILLKPAQKGKGVMAGGAARIILELSGIHNVTSKILGNHNKINVARSTIKALDSLKKIEIKKPSPAKTEVEKAQEK
ncbi:MAG: 30S ribosomal protein S5 [bacterium]